MKALPERKWSAPIVGATSISQLETIFRTPELQLDTEDIDLLDKVSR